MDMHIYFHKDKATEQKLDLLYQLLGTISVQIQSQGHTIMTTLKDIQTKVTDLTSKVERETNLDNSILTLVQGLGGVVASLKQQLADAIAANDPAALQAVVDGLSAAETTMDENATKLADAVTANLPPAA